MCVYFLLILRHVRALVLVLVLVLRNVRVLVHVRVIASVLVLVLVLVFELVRALVFGFSYTCNYAKYVLLFLRILVIRLL